MSSPCDCVRLWFFHFLICRNELWHKCFPSMHMRIAGSSGLSCCSWYFMQSHKMTKHKIHVDEFAGKLCVATNHQVFLVYSLNHFATTKGRALILLLSLFFPTWGQIRFYNVQQHITMFSHRCASHCDNVCAISERARTFNEKMCFSLHESGSYGVCMSSIRMCRNIFKSTSSSEVNVSLVGINSDMDVPIEAHRKFWTNEIETKHTHIYIKKKKAKKGFVSVRN